MCTLQWAWDVVTSVIFPLLASAAPPAGAWPGVLDAALQSRDSYSLIAQLLLPHCQVQVKYPSMKQPITCTCIQNNYYILDMPQAMQFSLMTRAL